ncbi:MAG: TIGR03546 family protein [Gammaproteobacteria bacterium]|nr:TIGR03546 family protein [Gammaproteobacteria bacterium]
MLTLLAKTLSALNSDSSPFQLSLALALAMMVAFNSILSLAGVVALVLLIVLRVNLGAFFIGLGLFAAINLMLNNAFISVGERLLTSEGLLEIWTSLYQSYWFRLANLNNTLVMGALTVSIILFIPVTLLGYFLVVKYRTWFLAFVNKFKVIQTLKASKFYQVYDAIKA